MLFTELPGNIIQENERSPLSAYPSLICIFSFVNLVIAQVFSGNELSVYERLNSVVNVP